MTSMRQSHGHKHHATVATDEADEVGAVGKASEGKTMLYELHELHEAHDAEEDAEDDVERERELAARVVRQFSGCSAAISRNLRPLYQWRHEV